MLIVSENVFNYFVGAACVVGAVIIWMRKNAELSRQCCQFEEISLSKDIQISLFKSCIYTNL